MYYEEAAKITSYIVKGKLYYKEQIQDGSDCNRLVKRRDFFKCHFTVGGYMQREGCYPRGSIKRDISQMFTQRNQGEGTHS